MSFPDQQFRLDDLTRPAGATTPPTKRRGVWVALIVVSAVALVAITATAVLLLTGRNSSSPSGAAATPESNGIKRPDPSCVTTTGTDHSDMWDANGWWAGRIDGDAREMPAFAVLGLKLDGHQISSAWICAPRSTN